MSVVLAIFPNTRGIGFACIERPNTLLDSGMATVSPIVNGPMLKRAEKMMDFYRPTVVVVRDPGPESIRGKRITQLVEDIAKAAYGRKLSVRRYSRQQVKDVFETFGASTKHEIAQAIVRWLPELEKRAPETRKPWMPEDYHMGVFDAAALAYTYGYLEEW